MESQLLTSKSWLLGKNCYFHPIHSHTSLETLKSKTFYWWLQQVLSKTFIFPFCTNVCLRKRPKNKSFFVESWNSDHVPVKLQPLQLLTLGKIPSAEQIHTAEWLFFLISYENRWSQDLENCLIRVDKKEKFAAGIWLMWKFPLTRARYHSVWVRVTPLWY